MAKIARYIGNLKAFASAALGTERTIFGSVTQADDLTSQVNANYLRGWGVVGPSDSPALEDFNGAMYTHGQLIAYLHQAGIAEYDAAQEYFSGSVAQLSGVIYISLQNSNIGNAPAAPSSTFWKSISKGQLLSVRTITASGVYTSTPGTSFVVAEVQGACAASGGAPATGAGAASIGAPGGAGAYARALITSAFSGVTITVGLGGTGVLGAAGNNGGLSSFGALVSSPGGIGGVTAGPAGSAFEAASNSTAAPTGGNIDSAIGLRGTTSLSLTPTAIFLGNPGQARLGGLGGLATANTPSLAAKTGNNGDNGKVIVWEWSL